MQKLILLLVLMVAACRGPAPAKVEVKPSAEAAIQAAVQAVEISHLLAPPIDALPDDSIRGLAIPMYSEFPGLLYEDMVKRAISLGATHVSLVVTWDQRTIFDNRIRPHVGQQFQHGAHIGDQRQIAQDDGLGGQQTGGQHRQRGILVAGRAVDTAHRPAAFNDKSGHRKRLRSYRGEPFVARFWFVRFIAPDGATSCVLRHR